MDAGWISIVDTIVKIGLGSFITAASGYRMILINQTHENNKEQRAKFYDQQNERKSIYVKFMTLAQLLTQKYLYSSCSCDTEEYNIYLGAYGELQIISAEKVRVAAYNYHYAVNQFIVANKNGMSVSDKKIYRNELNESLGHFQLVANEDATQIYNPT